MASPGKQHCASCIGTLSLSLQCALSVCLYLLGSQKLFSSAVCPCVCMCAVCIPSCKELEFSGGSPSAVSSL